MDKSLKSLDFFNCKRTIYFPVYVGAPESFVTNWHNKPEELKEKYPNYTNSLRIWDENDKDAYFYYPYALFSSYYFSKTNLQKEYGITTDKVCVFADSGGYQLATGVASPKKHTRETALRWAEENASVTPILDYPVFTKGKSFEETNKYSIESAKYIAENRDTSKDLRVLNVLSGAGIASFSQWYEAGIKNYQFEGWAYGGSGSAVTHYLSAILFLMYKGVYTPDMPKTMIHHTLGVSRSETYLYLAYVQKLLNDMSIPVQITFDSSVASYHTIYARVMYNIGINGASLYAISKKDEEIGKAFKKMTEDGYGLGCDCPCCRNMKRLDLLTDPDQYAQYYAWMWLHNLYHQIRYKNQIDFLINTNSDFVYNESFPKNVYKSLKLIKLMFENPASVIENRSSPIIAELNKLNNKGKALEQTTNLSKFFGEEE